MTPTILDLADQAWRGQRPGGHGATAMRLQGSAEVADGTLFIAPGAGGNVIAFRTDEGILLFDTGGRPAGQAIVTALHAWDPRPVHTAVYSHGHIDHVFGILALDAEAREQGRPLPHVIAHEAMPARFDRYTRTAGYNTTINRRQFAGRRAGGQALGLPMQWPVAYREPDETYQTAHVLTLGGERFELHHGRGETDDHTWLWAPVRGVLCTGDFFIWVLPNAGNPQKVQRYAGDWALALRAMAACEAEVLLPGHGFPIVGRERVRTALTDTAEVLESLCEQALALMNRGARLDEVIHSVRAPEHLLAKPYLAPLYDEPEFIVRNIWRLYGGWHDGNPANLKPAPESALASELATLAGGAARLAARARELAAAGDLRLAAHLAEFAGLAAPEDPLVQGIRAEVYEQRAAAEQSLMSRGIFSTAAAEARVVAEPPPSD